MTNPVIGYLAGVIWPRSLALLKAMSPNVFALCEAAAGGLGGVERSRKARVICSRQHPSPTLFRLVDGGDSGNQAPTLPVPNGEYTLGGITQHQLLFYGVYIICRGSTASLILAVLPAVGCLAPPRHL
mgnify:CR=1 FL=1